MRLLDIIRELRAKPKVWKGQPFEIAEKKLNGHRVTIVKDGSIFAFGRKPYIDLWPRLRFIEGLEDSIESLPDRTVVDGEGYATDGDATDFVTSLNGRDAQFACFAMPYHGGRPLGSITALQGRLEVARLTNLAQPDVVDVAGKSRQEMLRDIRKAKIEGYVFKINHYSGWFKLKPLNTIDVIVTGWIEGKKSGKHQGLMGSLSVSLWEDGGLVEVGRVGGWNDAERTLTPEDVVGRVLEVKCEGLASQGRMKFARRIRWRDDKPLRECGINQLEDL